MKIAVVGDEFFPAAVLADAIRRLGAGDELTVADLQEHSAATDDHAGIREYVGSPSDVVALLDDHDALVVHAAPVTAAAPMNCLRSIADLP